MSKLSPPRNLSCSVCGARTRGRQWHNRDTGYGVCTACALHVAAKEGDGAAFSYYGHRGIHWDLDYPTSPESVVERLLAAEMERDPDAERASFQVGYLVGLLGTVIRDCPGARELIEARLKIVQSKPIA